MKRASKHRIKTNLALATLSVCLSLTGVVSAGPSREYRHASGIAVVGAGTYQARPSDESQAKALDKALRAAQANPEDFGYPWLDSHGSLMQRYATPRGLQLSASVESAVPRREESVHRSYGQLEKIKHEITLLSKAGVTDADLIWRTEPDDEKNRVIITVTRLSEKLMAELAALYGTEAIAVLVEARPQPMRLTNRQNEGRPFSGGARFFAENGTGCTLGFAWSLGFITAGHCLDTGGKSNGPSGGSIGTTTRSTDENYNEGTGTVLFPGSSTYRGDIALIRNPDAGNARAAIYIGSSDSNTVRGVTDMWDRRAMVGDRYCTGGAVTGEVCDWEVTRTRMDQDTEWGVWTRNITEGKRQSSGIQEGDSGGPVYTYRSDGTIAAKGIISASRWFPLNTYYSYFTDIWDAYEAFPGSLRTTWDSGRYQVSNRNSGKCLAIGSSSIVNGAQAIQWTCGISPGQTWQIEPHPSAYPWAWIKNGSGKCLAIGSSSTANGAKAIQWECLEGSVGQRWLVQPDGTIVNGSGKCMSVEGDSIENTAKIVQRTCSTSTAQKWTWRPLL